jgi:hypothetical protein
MTPLSDNPGAPEAGRHEKTPLGVAVVAIVAIIALASPDAFGDVAERLFSLASWWPLGVLAGIVATILAVVAVLRRLHEHEEAQLRELEILAHRAAAAAARRAN